MCGFTTIFMLDVFLSIFFSSIKMVRLHVSHLAWSNFYAFTRRIKKQQLETKKIVLLVDLYAQSHPTAHTFLIM